MLMNEYVIDLYDFQKDADVFGKNDIIKNPDKNVTKERARELAKPSCKTCWGNGWVLHDYLPYFMRTQFCDCITKKIERQTKLEELHQEYIKDGKEDIWENGFRISVAQETKWGRRLLIQFSKLEIDPNIEQIPEEEFK